MTMALIVSVLGTLTTLVCAVLLLRQYHGSRLKMLLWSGLCFVGLTLANALLIVDIFVFPDYDMYMLRLGCAAAAMCLLVYGLIWENQ